MSTLGVEPRTYRSEVCRANPLRHAPLLMVGCANRPGDVHQEWKICGCARDGLPRGYVLAHCPVFIDRIETTARAPKGSRRGDRRLAARAIPVKRTVRKGDIFIRLESHAALHPRRAPSVSNRVPHPLSQRFTPYVSATYPIPATNPAPRSAPYAYAAASVVVVAAPVDDVDAEASPRAPPSRATRSSPSSRRESPGYAG